MPQKGNTKQAAACLSHKPRYANAASKSRLQSIQNKVETQRVSYVPRSACLALLKVVYHKISDLYTENFSRPRMADI